MNLKKLINPKFFEEVKVSKLNENKGQDVATELIAKLRRTTYRQLSDLELEAFSNEMIQHLGGTLK